MFSSSYASFDVPVVYTYARASDVRINSSEVEDPNFDEEDHPERAHYDSPPRD